MVTSSLPLSVSAFTYNPIVINTLKIWNQFREHFGFKHFLHISPICTNHLFLPAKLDSAFSTWRRQGISSFKDAYIGSIFPSFDELSVKFNLRRSDMFRYFQVRHFLRNSDPNFPNLPQNTVLDDMLETSPNSKGLISRLTDIITSLKNVTLSKIKTDWEKELGINIEDESWNCALQSINSSIFCAKLGIIQFKVLHRVHLSKARLAKMYSNDDTFCDRCHNTPANLTPMFCSCPPLANYWLSIFHFLLESLNVDLQPNPLTAIFGISDSKSHRTIIAFTSLLARRRILLHWKSKHPPKASMWLSDLMQFIQLEKIKYSLRGSRNKFLTIWGPILTYIDNIKSITDIE